MLASWLLRKGLEIGSITAALATADILTSRASILESVIILKYQPEGMAISLQL